MTMHKNRGFWPLVGPSRFLSCSDAPALPAKPSLLLKASRIVRRLRLHARAEMRARWGPCKPMSFFPAQALCAMRRPLTLLQLLVMVLALAVTLATVQAEDYSPTWNIQAGKWAH